MDRGEGLSISNDVDPDGGSLTEPPPVRSSMAMRRLSSAYTNHPRLKLATLLAAPMAWIVLIYLASLAVLLISAFWTFDTFSATIVKTFSLDNFIELATTDVYRVITLRTIRIAALTTVIDVVIAIPIAYFCARVARPRNRTIILVLLVLPLWTSYLVKIFAWQTMLQTGGLLDYVLPFNVGYSETAVLIVMSYLWLPYVVLPIYGSLERLPGSLLEASADLGAHSRTTFMRVTLPLAVPGIVAGSIFSFALTLGDYIAPSIVGGKTQFIGNVIYDNVGVAGNVPFAAAYAMVPIAVIGVYLALAKRTGAFEAL